MLKQERIKGIFHETIPSVGKYLAIFSVMVAAACSTTGPVKSNQSPIVTQNGAVIDYALPRNLMPTHVIGCFSMDKASNTWTPADIFPAMRKCITRSNYSDAVDLFTMATSYGRFDMARVADRSSWNAMQVLQMQYMQDVTPAQKAGFNKAAEAMLQNRGQICSELKTLGPPEYVPKYMLEHGMAAFTGTLENGGLVENFNAQTAWANVLHDYVHCE